MMEESETKKMKKKKSTSRVGTTTIKSLDHDILCIIFSFLGFFDIVRSSAVCKHWNGIITRSKLLMSLYCKQQKDAGCSSNSSNYSEISLQLYLEKLAMEHHKLSLQEGDIYIDQWRGHSKGVGKCRMKMGYILTGVGDKVMRLWSPDGYRCVEAYSVPDPSPLIDFDFDESKIVGLVDTRICIWRRNGNRSIFPPREGTFTKGLCLSYLDPEAIVGCEDGTARVFDMYSRNCSRIIRTNSGPITCMTLSEDQLLISGSVTGRITISDLSSDQEIATLRSSNPTGIKTLCFNGRSNYVFTGSTSGYTSCWDIRMMRALWEKRVSPNVIYSLQHLQNDTSTLAVGGIDGVLRIIDQNTGEVLSGFVMNAEGCRSSQNNNGMLERRKGRRIPEDTHIDSIPRSFRPPITCLAVGMKKVVTTHNGNYIIVWKFNK